ncbi:MAG: ABC transporter ATP-binding protein [Burkholderiaceae bacterium]
MKRQGAHIALEGVGHQYRRGAEPVLENIAFEVQPGQCIALVGRSGCGKSTLLHILCGLSLASRGNVYIDGARVADPSPDWVMMFQAPSLLPWMTVRGNVGLGLRFAGRRDGLDARVDEMLALVDLSPFAERNVQDLSGGQQQRVALARSLAPEPDLLLLDEPFSALDTFTRHALQRDVRRIAKERGLTLVFVTHDINEAVTMADRALIMAANPGRVVADIPIDLDAERSSGDPAFVRARETLLAAYEDASGQPGLSARRSSQGRRDTAGAMPRALERASG